MKPIYNPHIHANMPHGTREAVFGKGQPQYIPLPALVTPDGRVVSVWEPNPGDLALLNAGAPITLTVWHKTFEHVCPCCGERRDHLLHPVQLVVGGINGEGQGRV